MRSVAAVLPVLARSREEGALILDAIVALARFAIPIYVADGGSRDAGFLDRLAHQERVHVDRVDLRAGLPLVGQIKTAVNRARSSNPDLVLYSEPDKLWFFENRAEAFLCADPQGGMLVASRDAASFATYPAGQQLAETSMNRLCAAQFGQDGDYLYGPLLIDAAVLPLLDRLDEDVRWGWRPYLMARVQAASRPVRLWVDHLPCPAEQRGEDARIYRMEQLSQNVAGLALGLRHAAH